MNAVERAKLALKVSTDTALASALGVHQSVIGGYKRRDSVPLEQCIKIADKTGVDLNWLILGKGIAPDGKSTITSDDFLKIPVYDIQASAGNGIFNEFEVVIDQLWLPPNWVYSEGLYEENLFCVEALGDSMAHPPSMIMPRDRVLINRAVLHDDGVFLVRVGAALRLKRLQWWTDGRLTLSSDNPIYLPETINPPIMGDAFQVLGHAHAKFGSLI